MKTAMNVFSAKENRQPTLAPTIQHDLGMVQGHGYGQWFLIMAFLHPLAWLLLKWGGVHRLSPAGN